MADHLGKERRRHPRVKLFAARGSAATLTPVALEGAHASASLLPALDHDVRVKTSGLPGKPMLKGVALAGLGLAVWGGAAFVAFRLVMIGAAWATGRSGDAVTT